MLQCVHKAVLARFRKKLTANTTNKLPAATAFGLYLNHLLNSKMYSSGQGIVEWFRCKHLSATSPFGFWLSFAFSFAVFCAFSYCDYDLIYCSREIVLAPQFVFAILKNRFHLIIVRCESV